MWAAAALLLSLPLAANAQQVTATGTNGPTNPSQPTYAAVGSKIDQQSNSRLVSIDGIDDWCIYAPQNPGPDSWIGNQEDKVVAWCTKPRNGARVIPDGAVQGVQLLQTPSYVQISGQWDGTRVNIPAGDAGGELDPHGATGEGNPVGGNVTTHLATGNNVFYEEWMMFIGANQFCFRICTANLNGVGVDKQCEHIYDVMGCQWVMALDPNTFYSNQFISCKADVAAAPGVYGGYTWYQGMEPTPSTPAYIPASSQCTTYATISNGLNAASLTANKATVTAAPQFTDAAAAHC